MHFVFLDPSVPLCSLLLRKKNPYIGRGLEFNSWGSSLVYMYPTDVSSLCWMLNDLNPLVQCHTFYFKLTACLHAPCVLHELCFWSQPGFATEVYTPRVGFVVGFLILHVTCCPPPFSPAMLAESAVEWMTVQIELYFWDLAIRLAWSDARLQAGTMACTAVTCVIVSSCLLWGQILPWLSIWKPLPSLE